MLSHSFRKTVLFAISAIFIGVSAAASITLAIRGYWENTDFIHPFLNNSPSKVLGISDQGQGTTTTINWSNPGEGSGWFEYGPSRKYENKYQFSSGQAQKQLSKQKRHRQ